MKFSIRYAAAVIVLSLASSTTLFAQFPVPQTDETAPQSTCPGCPPIRTSVSSTTAPVLKTVAFGDPILAFTGRFLDSVFVGDWQAFFRTGRASNAMYVPQRGRILVKVGSAIAAYDVNTFFSRLASREALKSAASFPILSVNNGSIPARNSSGGIYAYEHFLGWDKYFYPEYTNSGWVTNLGDGQEKMSAYDADDRGYVYLGGPEYHWGIVYDDKGTGGTLMDTLFQDSSFGPEAIYVAKGTGGHYYAMVGRAVDHAMQVWDVTTPANPQRLSRPMPFFYQDGAHTNDHFAGVTPDGGLYLWSGDNVASGTFDRKIVNSKGYGYICVTSDGTNFYAGAGVYPNSSVTILRPDGNGGYTQNDYMITDATHPLEIHSIRATGGQYIGVLGALDYPHLFKLVNGAMQEVPFFNDFMQRYYRTPGQGYASPAGIVPTSFMPIAFGGKQYVLADLYSIGDVFEIKNEDSIFAQLQGHAGTLNGNAPARLNPTDVFYGDKVGFTAASGGTTTRSITWNFGNAETAADPNTTAGSTGTPVIHQYSGLTTAQVPATRTVSATDNTTGSGGTTTVTLKMPVARIGIQGVTPLITQTTAPAAIVAGDHFFDGSDGDVEGHYAEWNIDGTTTLTKPVTSDGSYLVGVGACGAHTLNFAAHYGPYSATPATIGPDFKVGLTGAGGFAYTVQPFTAALGAPQRDSVNNAVVFSATTRVATDTTIVPLALASTLTYRWDLVDQNDAVVSAGPTATGITTIPNWSAPLTLFTAPNLRARLTLTAPTAPGGSCANATSVKVYTTALNAPDPVINGDCTQGGPPCSFSVVSASNVNITTDGWQISWSLSPGTATPSIGSGATFAPTFSANGTYTLTVTATNSIGTRQANKTVNVTKSFSCPTMTSDNMFLIYAGSSSGCRSGNATNCTSTESIEFTASPSGYPITCAAHTFSWNFGDNTTSSGADVNHTYGSAGTRNVTLTVSNAQQIFSQSVSVPVAGPIINPPPPPPPQGCAPMTTDNWLLTFAGTPSGCSWNNNSTVACGTNESISFSLQPSNYLISCASHSFSWNFNDGSAAVLGQSPFHTFAASGTYNVVVTVNNGTQTLNVPGTVRVGTGGGNSCATMDSGNTFVQYTAPSGCNHASTKPCAANETVQLSAGFFGYNDSCATHTYTWDYGDGKPGDSGRAVTHQFSAGSYTVKVTVNNGKQSFTATAPLVVASDIKATYVPDFTFFADVLNPDLIVFAPTVTPANTPISKVVWDFGDGTQLTKTVLSQVTNVYGKAGDYTVTFTVYSTDTTSAAKSKKITVTLPSRTRGVRH